MDKLKYKVGDRVKIKSFDWFRAIEYNSFSTLQSRYYGEILTIKSVNEKLQYYCMVEDGGQYCWTEATIEGKI